MRNSVAIAGIGYKGMEDLSLSAWVYYVSGPDSFKNLRIFYNYTF